MHELRNLQQQFLGHMLDDAESGIIERIESSATRSASQRMALYGTAYALRLKEAIATDYEQLHSYLGDDLFDSLSEAYINRYPSRHPNLRYFSGHMVELVADLAPYNEHPEVIEIARIEKAFADSFDASDCTAVTRDDLTTLDPEQWATLTVGLHEAVQLLPQRLNSFKIWQALANEQAPPALTPEQTTWVVWRQDLVSHYRALDDAELAALNVVIQGGDFSEVCLALLSHVDEQQAPAKAVGFLQQWIDDQMVCSLV